MSPRPRRPCIGRWDHKRRQYVLHCRPCGYQQLGGYGREWRKPAQLIEAAMRHLKLWHRHGRMPKTFEEW